MNWNRVLLIFMSMLFVISIAFSETVVRKEPADAWKDESGLPQPSSMDNAKFEAFLYEFLRERVYADTSKHWGVDKRIRDTGPFIKDTYYGIHPAVRMYYSPKFLKWVVDGRNGNPPNGSVIIKEMFSGPAIKYRGMTDEQLADTSMLKMWTVMIRDSSASWDGWYWGSYNAGQAIDDPAYYDPKKGFRPSHSGFSTYCLRCHAAPEDHLTFSSKENIKGQEGNPIQYTYDQTWDPLPQATKVTTVGEKDNAYGEHAANYLDIIAAWFPKNRISQSKNPNYQDFKEMFSKNKGLEQSEVKTIPPRGFDHTVVTPGNTLQFTTSDNCMPCHSGSNSTAYGVNMFIADENGPGGKGWNISPYGEWQGSMMGLAGRDPIFFAQLESERAVHNQNGLPEMLQNTCLSCHGVMGQRQFHIDNGENKKPFLEKYVFEKGSDPNSIYGGLARDGISCMVCHQIVDSGGPLIDIATGKFKVDPPGTHEKTKDGKNISWIYGPYEKVSSHPMMEGLGMRPKYNSFIKESRLCASCHTVYLPVFDGKGKPVEDSKDKTGKMHVYEQSTYLEWQNSIYQNEVYPISSEMKTCQGCHMPETFPFAPGGKRIKNVQIANVQDQSYPQADHQADFDSLFVERRDTFSRHTLLGINQFGLEMFNQFDSILGIYKLDYMTGSPIMEQAISSSQILATEQTAQLEVLALSQKGNVLNAEIEVRSLVGHRFPSGVGFRRAFLEFRVKNEKGETIWVSGNTNSLGVILGADGKQLPSEFFKIVDGKQSYQPHHDTITSEDQVQIYQELVKDPEGNFTTSFISIFKHVKDNRLLPKGWKQYPKAIIDPKQREATWPKGKAKDDKDFVGGSDKITYQVKVPAGQKAATIEVSLYYQAIPPYYLKDRFDTATGDAGQRLLYLTSNLDLSKTNIGDWKLKVTSLTMNCE
jgi:cytochrome c553